MDAQEYIALLRANKAPTIAASSIPEVLKVAPVEKDDTPDFKPAGKPTPTVKNPYSQPDLQEFVEEAGFEVDEVPRFSEIMRRLFPNIAQNNTEKDLDSLDNHEVIADVSPIAKNEQDEASREALKRIIAKYK